MQADDRYRTELGVYFTLQPSNKVTVAVGAIELRCIMCKLLEKAYNKRTSRDNATPRVAHRIGSGCAHVPFEWEACLRVHATVDVAPMRAACFWSLMCG